MLYGQNGPVARAVHNVTRRVENAAKRRSPADEGTLRASIQGIVEIQPPLIIGRVGSHLDYALYVHEGTGIYGPRRRMITPITAKVLVFEPGRRPARGNHGLVFATAVRGQQRNPFLADALRAESPWPVIVHTPH